MQIKQSSEFNKFFYYYLFTTLQSIQVTSFKLADKFDWHKTLKPAGNLLAICEQSVAYSQKDSNI